MFPFANYKKLHFFKIFCESGLSQSITLGCQFSVFKNADMTSRHSKTPNATTFSTPLNIISAPGVCLTIRRIRPVTFLPPPFHLRCRRSGSRSRGGRRSRSRERDRSRRKGHEREKDRDRGRGRDNERDKSKERADKKR